MSIPSDNPILLARDLGPTEGDPLVSLAVGDGEVVALTRETTAQDLDRAPDHYSQDHSPEHVPDRASDPRARAHDQAPDHTRDQADAAPLLRCLAGTEPSAHGELWIKGVPLHTLRPAARIRFGHSQCAVLPRTSRLLPELNMTDNTALPLLLSGISRTESRKRARDWLARLQVAEYAEHRLSELPVTVIRRVAMARALVTDPTILLADEPLLGLDAADQFNLLRIMRAAAGSHGLTVVVATGDPMVVEWADRRIVLPAEQPLSAPSPSSPPPSPSPATTKLRTHAENEHAAVGSHP